MHRVGELVEASASGGCGCAVVAVHVSWHIRLSSAAVDLCLEEKYKSSILSFIVFKL